MDKKEITVLKPIQLAQRWQISITKVYEDNNAGLIPHLKNSRNRFPIKAIEELENEFEFDKRDIPTPLERKLKRKITELEEIIKTKDNEIEKLRSKITKVCAFLIEDVYSDIIKQNNKK